MRVGAQLLLTFLLNASWQIALVFAFAAACDWTRQQASKLQKSHLKYADICHEVLELIPDMGGNAEELFPNPERACSAGSSAGSR